MTNEEIKAFERKADEMFQSMMKRQFELESGSIVMPESVYATTVSTATTAAFKPGDCEKMIREALHELKKLEDDFKNRVDVIVMTAARFKELNDFMVKEYVRIGAPKANPLLESFYGIKIETFATQELCRFHAKLMVLNGTKVMLIEEE